MNYSEKSDLVEAPYVEIDSFHSDEKTLIIHNYVNTKGKIFLQ